MDNRPDRGRVDFFRVQQRLHLLHFFVSETVLHRRRWSPARTSSAYRGRLPSVAIPGSGASDTHPFITPRISHSTTATTMQSNAKSAQQSAVKIYNAVYSSVQVCPSLSFLPIHRNLTSATIARRSMNVWSEASRSCAGARTPT